MFDMFVRASVRPKGFALSQWQAWLTIPNYQVACFAYSKDPQLKHLYGVLTSISAFLRESEFAWARLVNCYEGPFSRKARAMVEHNSNSEIGLALVDVSSQETTTAWPYLARSMRRLLACFN